MKYDIFFTYFESSLKFFIQIKKLAFISTQFQTVQCQGNKTNFNRLFNLSSSKSYYQRFFMNFYNNKIGNYQLLLHKLKKCIIGAT